MSIRSIVKAAALCWVLPPRERTERLPPTIRGERVARVAQLLERLGGSRGGLVVEELPGQDAVCVVAVGPQAHRLRASLAVLLDEADDDSTHDEEAQHGA